MRHAALLQHPGNTMVLCLTGATMRHAALLRHLKITAARSDDADAALLQRLKDTAQETTVLNTRPLLLWCHRWVCLGETGCST
jgi:hypothetical protein